MKCLHKDAVVTKNIKMQFMSNCLSLPQMSNIAHFCCYQSYQEAPSPRIKHSVSESMSVRAKHEVITHKSKTTPKENKSRSTRARHLGRGYPAPRQLDEPDRLLRPLGALFLMIYTNSSCAGLAGFKSIPLNKHKGKVDTSRAKKFCRLFSSP